MNWVVHSITLLEVIAFLLSIYFYRADRKRIYWIIVLFLGFIVLFENAGKYTFYLNHFPFLKATPFEKNYWLFNIQLIVSMVFYSSFFILQVESFKLRKAFFFVIILFFFSAFFFLFLNNNFFKGFSPFTLIVGSGMVLLSILFYYYDLLKSQSILYIQKSLPFYISVGAFVFHLCTTPLFIYSIYFREHINPGFTKLYISVIYFCNIVLYISYIVGFSVCRPKKSVNAEE